MKRWVLGAGLLLIIIVISLLPISDFLVKSAVQHPREEWAPWAAYTGARIQMRLFRWDEAISSLKTAMNYFPRYRKLPEAYFWMGLCYEDSNRPKEAMQWYQSFIQRWPQHRWAAQAENRLRRLQAAETL
jgi:TolA-binding protein